MHWLRTSRRVLPCIAVIYLIAAGLAAFSFKPGLIAAAAAQPRMQALPDGTVPSLCMVGPDGAADSHPDKVTHACDFCRLAAAPGLLAVTPGLLHRLTYIQIATLRPTVAAFKPRSVYRATVRAPPFVSA